MNKLFTSIFALAVISGAAYASNERGYDPRDSDTCMGKYCNNVEESSVSTTITVVSPLAIEEKDFGLSNFERMNKLSEENDRGRH
jgi:hypothetical protein